MDEKQKIKNYRIIAIILLVITFFIAIIGSKRASNLKVLNHSVDIINYYPELNEYVCKTDADFNMKVKSGYMTISFYNQYDNLVDTVQVYCYANGNHVSNGYFKVQSGVDHYHISKIEIKPEKNFTFTTVLLIIEIVFFFGTLWITFKEYDINENKIIVYAGFYHHYIKINGKKCTELNDAIPWSAINLTYKINDDLIECSITFKNRILTKINGTILK